MPLTLHNVLVGIAALAVIAVVSIAAGALLAFLGGDDDV